MAEHKPQPIPEESLQRGYEVRDAGIRLVVGLSIGIIALVVLAFIGIGLFYNFLNINQAAQLGPPPPLLEEAQGLPPAPLLQRDPALEMQEMHSQQEADLNDYGWVDKEAGVVRIPIKRAIELTLERGLPTRPQSEE